jgi:uncharacterized protein (DUF4415 family)
MTEKMVAGLRPMDKEMIDYVARSRGRPKSQSPKKTISLRVDQDVLGYFKSTGPGWQTKINDALRTSAAKIYKESSEAAVAGKKSAARKARR